MKMIRNAYGTALASALLLALGCERGDATTDSGDETYSVAQEALEESGSADEDGSLSELAFPIDPATGDGSPDDGEPATLEDYAAKAKGWVKKNLSCALSTDVSGGARIQFTKDCTWNGRRWEGEVTIVYTAPDVAEITFEGLSVNGRHTTGGTLTVTRLGEGHVEVEGTRETSFGNGNRVVTATLTGEYRWDEEAVEVISAERTRSVGNHVATMTTTGLRWLRSEISPESGTIVHTKNKGKTSFTVEFSRDEDTGELRVSVTGPGGVTKTFAPESLDD